MALTTAVVAGSVISAGFAAYGARQANRATGRATDQATAENRYQFDTIRGDTAAQRQLGQGATGLLARLYGLPVYDQATAQAQEMSSRPMLVGDTELPAGTTTKSVGNGWFEVLYGGQRIGTLRPGGSNGRFINDTGTDIAALFQQQAQQRQQQQATAPGPAPATPDMSAFFDTPDYRYNVEQVNRATDRSLLARGRGLSGAGVREAQRNAAGLASQQFGDTFNRLTTLAGLGSAATNMSAQAGLTTAGNNANILANAGNQRASAYMDRAAGVNNAFQGGLSNWLTLQQLRASGVNI